MAHPEEPAPRARAADALLRRIREAALARYPGAHLKSPWPGHLDLAVNDKTFAYLGASASPLSISVKLPVSNAFALMLPNVTPTGYGLGKSGWVTATFSDGDLPPVELLEEWIDESYRAQAPKKLVAQLDAAASPRATAAGSATAVPQAPGARTRKGTRTVTAKAPATATVKKRTAPVKKKTVTQTPAREPSPKAAPRRAR